MFFKKNHIIYIPLLSVLHICQDFRGFVVVYFVVFNVFQVLPFLSDLLYCLYHYFSHFQFHFVKCFDFVSLFILHPVLSLFCFFSLPPCFQLYPSISAPCIFLAGLYLPVAHPAKHLSQSFSLFSCTFFSFILIPHVHVLASCVFTVYKKTLFATSIVASVEWLHSVVVKDPLYAQKRTNREYCLKKLQETYLKEAVLEKKRWL